MKAFFKSVISFITKYWPWLGLAFSVFGFIVCLIGKHYIGLIGYTIAIVSIGTNFRYHYLIKNSYTKKG